MLIGLHLPCAAETMLGHAPGRILATTSKSAPVPFDHRHLTFLQVWRSGNTMERVAMASDADVGPYGHGRNENRFQLFEAPMIGRRKLDVSTDSSRRLGLTEDQPRGLFGATQRTG
jgi:hypothetical protein